MISKLKDDGWIRKPFPGSGEELGQDHPDQDRRAKISTQGLWPIRGAYRSRAWRVYRRLRLLVYARVECKRVQESPGRVDAARESERLTGAKLGATSVMVRVRYRTTKLSRVL